MLSHHFFLASPSGVPPSPQERGPFLHTMLRSFLLGFLTLDLLNASIKLILGIGDPKCNTGEAARARGWLPRRANP